MENLTDLDKFPPLNFHKIFNPPLFVSPSRISEKISLINICLIWNLDLPPTLHRGGGGGEGGEEKVSFPCCCCFYFNACDCYFYQTFIFSAYDSTWKTMKNTFFSLKKLFLFSRDLNFCISIFPSFLPASHCFIKDWR